MKIYRLSHPELRKRVEEIAGASSLESVKEEIILLRAMILERLEMAKSPAETIDATRSVTPTLISLVKCVETLSKLERQHDVVLGKEAATELGKDIIKILSEELEGIPKYESIIDRVASRIAHSIANARNND